MTDTNGLLEQLRKHVRFVIRDTVIFDDCDYVKEALKRFNARYKEVDLGLAVYAKDRMIAPEFKKFLLMLVTENIRISKSKLSTKRDNVAIAKAAAKAKVTIEYIIKWDIKPEDIELLRREVKKVTTFYLPVSTIKKLDKIRNELKMRSINELVNYIIHSFIKSYEEAKKEKQQLEAVN